MPAKSSNADQQPSPTSPTSQASKPSPPTTHLAPPAHHPATSRTIFPKAKPDPTTLKDKEECHDCGKFYQIGYELGTEQGYSHGWMRGVEDVKEAVDGKEWKERRLKRWEEDEFDKDDRFR
ncbi:hypothetical protein BDZ45DRAFT_674894 [Acephala macrosclerotiorum]|nr:hypothetical protein BDZ45DRAFT_674894 [Acephala macrosclerotiorum]